MPNRVVLAWILGAAATAAADDGTPPDVRFAVLDRQDATSRFGTEITWVGVGVARRVTLLRLDPHVAYVDRDLGIGAYAHMPFTSLSGQGTTGGAGAGGLELGGIFARELTPGLSGVAHAALVLPTASAGAVDANTFASIAHLPDFILAIPKATSVRIGVSPIVRARGVFARADLGLDVNLTADQPEREPPMVHVAAGVGYDSPAGLVAVETAHLRLASGRARWLDVIAISARFHPGAVHPYVAIALPLDADASANVTATATVGVDAQLP